MSNYLRLFLCTFYLFFWAKSTSAGSLSNSLFTPAINLLGLEGVVGEMEPTDESKPGREKPSKPTKPNSTSSVTPGANRTLPIWKPTGPDPIRFTMQSNKATVTLEEEVEITITAELLPIQPSQLFFLNQQKAFSLKLIKPASFVVTGGSYFDYTSYSFLDEKTNLVSYTLRGFFADSTQEAFILLRGALGATPNDVFEKKVELKLKIDARREANVSAASSDQKINKNEKGLGSAKLAAISVSPPTLYADYPVCAGQETATLQVIGCTGGWIQMQAQEGFRWCIQADPGGVTYMQVNAKAYIGRCIENPGSSCDNPVVTSEWSTSLILGTSSSPMPEGPTPISASVCTGGSVMLTAQCAVGLPNRWYDQPTGGTLITSNQTYFMTPNLSVTKVYYVSCVNSCAESNRVAVTATVKDCSNPCSTPTSPYIHKNNEYSNTGFIICRNTSVELWAENCTNGVKWFKDNQYGTIISTINPLVINNLAATTTFTARCVGSLGCMDSGNSNSVDVTVTDPPNTPSVHKNNYSTVKDFSVCRNSAVELWAEGCQNGVNWYKNGNSTVISTTNPLVVSSLADNATFRARCAGNNGCSDSELSNTVTVSVLNRPAAPTSVHQNGLPNTTISICLGGQVSLQADNCSNGAKWYDANNNYVGAGNPFTISDITQNNSYKAKCKDTNGCGDSDLSSQGVSVELGEASLPMSLTADKLMICRDETTYIRASTCNGEISWSDNSALRAQVRQITMPGTYRVYCTTECGFSRSEIQITPSPANYQSDINEISCERLRGWLVNHSCAEELNQVRILIDGQLVATISTTESRSEIRQNVMMRSNGFDQYGFNWPIPNQYRIGRHTITITDLNGIPLTNGANRSIGINLTASSNSPAGQVYADGTLSLSALTQGTAPSSYAWSGPNQFTSQQANPSIAYASALLTGTYSLTATTTDGCSALATTPVVITSGNFAGAVDFVRCDSLAGWVFDRHHAGVPSRVTIEIDGQPVETILTNSPRTDVRDTFGLGGSFANYGFRWAMPAHFRNSGVHTIRVYATNTGQVFDNYGASSFGINLTASSNSPAGQVYADGTLSLSALTQGTAPSSYAWSGPNQFTSQQANPSIAYASALLTGTYSLTATTTDGCSALATTPVVITSGNFAGAVDFVRCDSLAGWVFDRHHAGVPSRVTIEIDGQPVETILTNSPRTDVRDTFGLGGSFANYGFRWAMPAHFRNSGVHTIRVYATNTGQVFDNYGASSFGINLTASSNSPAGQVYADGTLSLSALTQGTAPSSYAWSGPNQFTSQQANPSIAYASALLTGTYSLTATTTDGCSALATTPVVITSGNFAGAVDFVRCDSLAGWVFDRHHAGVPSRVTIEIDGQPVETILTNSPRTDVRDTFGLGGSFANYGFRWAMPAHFRNSGVHTIRVYATNTGQVFDNYGASSFGINLTASSNSPAGQVYADGTLSLSALTQGTAPSSYAWSGPNQFTSQQANPSIAYASALLTGTYSLTATTTDGCSALATTPVVITSGNFAGAVDFVRCDSLAGWVFDRHHAGVPSRVTIEIDGQPVETILTNSPRTDVRDTFGLGGSFANYGFRWAMPAHFRNSGVHTIRVYATNTGQVFDNYGASSFGINLTASSNSPAGQVYADGTLSLSALTQGTAPSSYAWSGPNQFTSQQANPSIAYASALLTGTYSLTATTTDGCSALATTPVVITSGNFAGAVDFVRCDSLAGWVFDRHHAGVPSRVTIEIDGQPVETILTNSPRTDVRDTFGLGGSFANYGFRWAMPAHFRNSGVHTIRVYATNTGQVFDNYGASSFGINLTASSNSPAGQVYADGTLSLSALTQGTAPSSYAWSGPNQFTSQQANPSIAYASALLTGTYSLTATTTDGCSALATTPVVITSGNFAGAVDFVRCDSLAGWVFDRHHAGVPSRVTIEIDGQPVETILTNSPRTDVRDTFGLGGSFANYGFRWAMPAHFRNSGVHTIRVYATNTGQVFDNYGASSFGINLTASSNSPAGQVYADGTLSLSALTQGTAPSSYAWSGPNQFTSQQANPSIAYASALLTGTYSLTATTTDGCSALATTPVVITSGNFAGAVDFVRCDSLAGWVFDRHHAGVPSRVTIEIDGQPVETILTNSPRTDVRDTFGLGGSFANYGFRWAMPAHFRNSGVHTIRVYATNTGQVFDNYGASSFGINLTASSNSPAGQVYADGTLSLSALTQGTAPSSYAWSGPNQFTSQQANPSIAYASALLTGTYSLTATTTDGCSALATTPVVITSGNFAGAVDFVRCDSLAGWVFDRHHAGVPSRVTIEIDGQPVETILTNSPRTDVRDTFGLGGSFANYGFRWAMPAHFRNSGVHTIRVYATNTGQVFDNYGASSFGINLTASSNSPAGQVYADGTLSLSALTQGTAPSSYAWSGPNQFTSQQANPSIAYASALLTGTYSLTATTTDGCSALATTPVVITSGNFAGAVDFVRCDSLAGWVFDRHHAGVPSRVTIEIDGQPVETILTNSPRTDVRDTFGLGGSFANYGFRWAMPAHFRNSGVHTIRVYATNTGQVFDNYGASSFGIQPPTPVTFNGGSSTTFCQGTAVTLATTCSSGQMSWTYVSGPHPEVGMIGLSNSIIQPGNYPAGAYQYAVQCLTGDGCNSGATSATLTIIPKPLFGFAAAGSSPASYSANTAGPVTNTVTLCSGGMLTLSGLTRAQTNIGLIEQSLSSGNVTYDGVLQPTERAQNIIPPSAMAHAFNQSYGAYATTDNAIGTIEQRHIPFIDANGNDQYDKGECLGDQIILKYTIVPLTKPTSVSATPSTISSSQSITLTANGCSGTTQWQWPSGSASGSSIVVPVTQTTLFTARCVGTNGCLSEPESISVTLVNLPAPIIGASKLSVCSGEPVSLSAVGCPMGSTVSWSNGQTGASILVNPTTTTSFTATCTLDAAQGPASNALNITVGTNKLIVSLPNSVTHLDGETLTYGTGNVLSLTATLSQPAGYTIAWRGPRGFSSTGAVLNIGATLSPNMNGDVYIATATSTSGCSFSHTVPISVTGTAQSIAMDALPVTTVCQSGTLSVPFSTTGTFDAGNIFTVQLSDATGNFNAPTAIGTGNTSPVSATIGASTPAGTGYLIRVVSSSPAVNGSASLTSLTITAPPTAFTVTSSSPGGEVSPGGSVSLTASGQGLSGATYLWTGPSSFSSSQQNPTIPNATTAMSGSYTVVATTPGGCTVTASTSVSIGVTSFSCVCQDCELDSVKTTYNPPVAATNLGSATQNYVQESVYLDAQGSSVAQTITYLDGLGRPIEKVSVGTGGKPGASTDLVSIAQYDAFGREPISYLPFADGSTNGAYRGAGAGSVSSYYASQQRAGKAYTNVVYEASPLNRVIQQIAPGTDNIAVTSSYRTNTAGEVKLLTYDFTTKQISVSTYGAGELYVTELTDENLNKTIEYKDKAGRVVAKDASGRKTLYAYDDFGWLRCVVPPKSSASISGTFNPMAGDLLFSYDYDERGRLVTKKVPGAGATTMTYDSRDRLVSTTDANGNVITTEYDELDRVIATKKGGIVQTQLFYDTYGAEANAFDAAHGYATPSSQVRGMVTSAKTLVLGSSTYLTSSTYYDELGRDIQTVATNHKGGQDITSTKLDYTGRVLESKLSTTNSQTTITVETRTSYDVGSRVKAICQRVSDNQQTPITNATLAYWEPVARNSYNGLGELTRKTLGCSIQNMDYAYQMRGWLSQINDPANLNKGFLPADKHYFGMKLSYDPVGNITQWDYRAAQRQGDATTPYEIESKPLYSYAFSYDNLNRIKTGTLSQQGQSVFSLNGLNYDDNGNISSLQRTFQNTVVDNLSYVYKNGGNSNQLASVTDGGSNPGTPNAFFKDGTATYDYDANGNLINDSGKGITTPITYNQLNLPIQVNHSGGVVNYTYSASGQKLKTEFTGGTNANTYEYIAGLVYDKDGLEFIPTAEGRVLPPGRASSTITAGSSQTAVNAFYRYEYHLKDHLGNLRVACRCGEKANETSPSDTQTPIVVQENHYDPFGLDLMGLNVQSDLATNRFKFNGKENESAVGWIDFNWRHYDPSTARFFNVDKLAEKFPYMTPYQFASNDPVNKIELDGLEGVPVNPSAELWKASGFSHQPGPQESYQLGKSLLKGFLNAWATVALIAVPIEEAAVAGLGLAGKAIGIELKEVAATTKVIRTGGEEAKSVANLDKLNRSLASEAQLAEKGNPIAGAGTKKELRIAKDLAKEYGGSPTDYAKKGSSSYVANDGTKIEIHWEEDVRSGSRFNVKTKINNEQVPLPPGNRYKEKLDKIKKL